MLTKDEVIDKFADEFLWHLMPFGSLDIMHLMRTAYEVNIYPYELASILYEQAEQYEVNLFNNEHTTDLNALLNDYILRQADSDIYSLTDISIIDDYDVYYFANYLDCPLQYKTECQEAIEEAIKENNLTRDDFDLYSLYVLDEMNINFKNNESED